MGQHSQSDAINHIGPMFVQSPQTRFQITDNVAVCLLDVQIGNCLLTHEKFKLNNKATAVLCSPLIVLPIKWRLLLPPHKKK